jgi:hypothetical protein
MEFTVKQQMYVELRKDFVDVLYRSPTSGAISSCSLHSFASMLFGIVGDYEACIVADREVLLSKGCPVVPTQSAAHLMLLLFFKTFLDVFEAVVITDLHGGRRFVKNDTDLILSDIDVRFHRDVLMPAVD